MADTAAPRTSRAEAKSWKRYLLIGAPLVVAAAVLLFVFWPEIQIRGWINRLSKPEVRAEQIRALEAHEDRELVNRLLLEAVKDDDREFGARQTCASLLIRRQRLSQLERELRTGPLLTRGVILRALSRERFFRATYVEDPSFRAAETVREWLGREGDLTRSHAVQLAIEMDMRDAMPLIRPLLDATPAPNVHPRIQRELLLAAVEAAWKFADCSTLARLAEISRRHEDSLVRLRCLQAVDRMAIRETPAAPCAEAMAPDAMKSLVVGALDDADHAVRMKAMLILGRRVAWAAEVSDRLQSILDSQVTAPERRQALEALGSLAAPGFMERFPRYFLDPSAEVRSSAVRVAGRVQDVPLFSCLLGLLADETDSDLLFENAVLGLRETAGRWVGLPEALAEKAIRDRAGFKKDVNALFVRGEMEGVTRQAWGEAWFRWWCDHLQLTAEQTERAVSARKAFWTAKEARDATAASAALDALEFDVPGLFTYERAWLSTRGA